MAVGIILPIYLAYTSPELVVQTAQDMVGKKFLAGQSCQCANFVRWIFAKCGIILPNAANPTDSWLIPGEPIGPGYANSFAGDEIGPVIKPKYAVPGDIVMYKNTYGSWPDGVITHVGIYVGNGQVVHRPTSEGTVKMVPINYTSIAHLRRPKEFIKKVETEINPAPTPIMLDIK